MALGLKEEERSRVFIMRRNICLEISVLLRQQMNICKLFAAYEFTLEDGFRQRNICPVKTLKNTSNNVGQPLDLSSKSCENSVLKNIKKNMKR